MKNLRFAAGLLAVLLVGNLVVDLAHPSWSLAWDGLLTLFGLQMAWDVARGRRAAWRLLTLTTVAAVVLPAALGVLFPPSRRLFLIVLAPLVAYLALLLAPSTRAALRDEPGAVT